MTTPAQPELNCWYAATRDEALQEGRQVLRKVQAHLDPRRPAVDLDCGEGALVLALSESGARDVRGVEVNEDPYELARSFGAPVVRGDVLAFLEAGAPEAAQYLYIDVLEHVPMEVNVAMLDLLPEGSRLVLQTPSTRSLRGHEFHMNVPTHLAPYSPWVIRRMLEGAGYRIVDEGSVDHAAKPGPKRRLRAWRIRKALGLDPELLLGGGDHVVVADRVEQRRGGPGPDGAATGRP